jgi:hypothetical protein
MANVRIIYDNAAERATITASSTASGSIAAGTLGTNIKSVAHRSSGNQVQYTLEWATAEQINGIILPAISLSSDASIAVTVNSSTNLGTISACPSTSLDSYPGIKNANSFPYGGLSKVAYWFPQIYSVTRLDIVIADLGRVALGYPSTIDCSRIICGKYWSPTYNVSKNGLELTINDTTQTSRTDSGDLLADRGAIHELLTFNLEVLSKADKEQLINIMRYVGTYRNIAVSVVPDANSRDEQDYIIYGKRDNSSLGYIVHNFYQNNFSIVGW